MMSRLMSLIPSLNLFSSSVLPMLLLACTICLRSSSSRLIHRMMLPVCVETHLEIVIENNGFDWDRSITYMFTLRFLTLILPFFPCGMSIFIFLLNVTSHCVSARQNCIFFCLPQLFVTPRKTIRLNENFKNKPCS